MPATSRHTDRDCTVRFAVDVNADGSGAGDVEKRRPAVLSLRLWGTDGADADPGTGRDRRLGQSTARTGAGNAGAASPPRALRRGVAGPRRPDEQQLHLPGEHRPGRGHPAVSGRPQMARDIEATHADRRRPPLSPSDLPYPASELPTWAECFIPAGFHEALGVALYDGGERHVGHLGLLSCSKEPPPPVLRRRLHQLVPILARGIDPFRSLTAAARVVRGATAGAVLCCNGATGPLPGLDG